MKHKVGPIGLVFADDAIRAAQVLDGRTVCASVPMGENPKKSLRQLLSSAPFVGRTVVVGLQGSSVLIESIVLGPGMGKEARKNCADRLRGDPLFGQEKAFLGVAVENMPSTDGGPPQALAIMAAVNRERLGELMKICRECELDVAGVEAAALAAWRAWSGTGLQVRLVRSAGHDLVLAGMEGKLLFCRIVEAPIATSELRATITRAAALLGAEGFRTLSASGLDDESRNAIASDLGVDVKDPVNAMDDAIAAGLATAGPVLTDFTPPEERVLREKRRVRKVGMTMAAAAGVLVLCAGVLATQQISTLNSKKKELESQQKLVATEKAELDRINAELSHAKANETLIVAARPGHRMSTLFALIGARTTDMMSIDVLKVQDQGDTTGRTASSTGPLPHVLEVRINGVARNGTAVRAFADSLLASNAFSDVRVEASERVLVGVGMDGERFRIYARAETH